MTIETTIEIARSGFVMVRYLINRGQAELAKELADALHNLPRPGDTFNSTLTLKRLSAVLEKDKFLKREFSQFINLPAGETSL